MQVAMVGLGRMGANMARRLMRGGHAVVAYATDAAAVRQLAAEGAIGTATLDEMVDALRAPRVVWIMVYTRFRSRQDHTFAEKALSAMRQEFGGHLEPSAGG